MNNEQPPIAVRIVLWHTLVAFLATALLAWGAPLAFSGVRAAQPLSRFWLLLSDSGGAIPSGVLLLLAALWVALKQTGVRARVQKAGLFFGGAVVLVGSIALTNEHLSKPLVAAQRPYVQALQQQQLVDGQEFYALPSKAERSKALRGLFQTHSEHPYVAALDTDIKEHWVHETGFSFPSGHSLNAFLLAVMLGFLIQSFAPFGRFLVWTPFLWASAVSLSRVAVGAHSALDITVGALVGGLVGSLLLLYGLLQPILGSSERRRS